MALTLSKKASEVKPSSTLAITAKAKALKAQGVDLVGFGAGEPDFNTPDNINDVACEAIRNGFTKYTPASGIEDLKKAVSEKFKTFNKVDYGVDQIVISNGGKHSLTNIFTAIINEGDEVVIPAPFWLSYPEIVNWQVVFRSSLPLHRRMILRLRHSSWQRPVQIKQRHLF